mmetsp:Transcript_9878/g.13921  ORF Transcript_9878/g.13921 Transcript_9878/m.13921 type:complete len:246 (+) Transcript_9878:82-819(+)
MMCRSISIWLLSLCFIEARAFVVPKSASQLMTSPHIRNCQVSTRITHVFTRKSTSLSAAAPTMSLANKSVTWALLAVIGGTTGTPIVIRATRGKGWYRRINLPSWTPPDSIFGPVWTTLYSCMGYAAFKVYQLKGISSPTLKLAFLHYFLNLVWAPVFFGMQRLRAAHAINFFLLPSLLVIIPNFYRINPLSGLLLLPYLFWLSFATKLNETICRLNPTEKGYNNAMLEADISKLQDEAAKRVGL